MSDRRRDAAEDAPREARPEDGVDAAAATSAPRYVRIQKTLEERVVSGAYPIGSLMPTEVELAAEFETSRFTVREALRYLRERGYVERKQGVGTRVVSADPQAAFVQSFDTLQALFQVAVETTYVMLNVRPVSLSERVAERIGDSPGARWFEVDGVRWTRPGGQAICFIRSYVPSRFEALTAEFETHPGPLFSLLERHADAPIEEAVQEIRATAMPPEVARQLGRPSQTWALELFRRYIADGSVLIASFNWHPADEMTYTMRLKRSPNV